MSTSKLSNQTILILGGNTGIGLAVASLALASSASHVTISGSNASRLSTALETLRGAHPAAAAMGRITGYAADLADASTLEANLKALLDSTVAGNGSGKIDHTVWCAGDAIDPVAPRDYSVGFVQAAGVVRFVGPLILAKLLASYANPSYKSSFTLTGGVIAERPPPGWAVHAGYGNALLGLARGLSVDLAPLRVNLVAPGAIETSRWDQWGEDGKEALKRRYVERTTVGRFGQPEDVAEAYLYLMKDYFVTGTRISCDGGVLLM